MADIPRDQWIPEIPFDSSDFAEVPEDFVPLDERELEAARAKAKALPKGPPEFGTRD